ncbi:sensor histidine kinase [Geobacter sulfurreducens]|uniref:sensor histidine kinase n=1 Tax=Geobacter sulfurreducens TaxID=35554 RepID=UPI002CF79310|nr:PAS domain S-box protein [Geobacter sulfurreducens]HML79964.1 PAS domain S-box protein [Geobacter sulfurreducens]
MIFGIIALSLVLQLVAAILALRLIRVTGGAFAWTLLALASLLMVGRRSLALHHLYTTPPTVPPLLVNEVIGLIISLLFVAAVAGLSPLLARIKNAEDYWRESEHRLRGMLDNTGLIAVMLDDRGAITFCNRHLLDLTGWSREEVVGGNWFDTFIPVDQREGVIERYRHDLAGGELPLHSQNEIIKKSGERLLIAWHNTMMRDGSGRVVGGTAIGEDITERMRVEEEIRRLNTELEQRVSERTAELAASTRELEGFCYSVSHDLRTPLRAIAGHSAIIREECSAINHSCRHHLGRIERAAVRMSELIDALLELARVARHAAHPEEINLSRMAQQVLTDLRIASPERSVACAIDEGLTACGDPVLVRVALQNLLENAWKFTAGNPDALIEVGSETADGETVFFVRDNGVGFDMAHAGKMFGTFRRLHRDDEFEGTGIGLATVKRIIERHGGRVWAEGEPGRMAIFRFTLPGLRPCEPEHPADFLSSNAHAQGVPVNVSGK